MTAIERQREKRKTARLNRRCIDCKAGLQDEDGCRCVECAERDLVRSKRYRDSGRKRVLDRARQAARRAADRAAYNAEMRETRQEKKIAGICPDCSAPSTDETVRCQKHRDSHNAKRRK